MDTNIADSTSKKPMNKKFMLLFAVLILTGG